MTQNLLLHNKIVTKELNEKRIKLFNSKNIENYSVQLPEIIFISSYPPRECGIATYTQDLVEALNRKFTNTFDFTICALETKLDAYNYTISPKYILNTDEENSYLNIAFKINKNDNIQIVVIQHEFGLFAANELYFKSFCASLEKPIIYIFHTVLPEPNPILKQNVIEMGNQAEAVVVMTQNSRQILEFEYGIDANKIIVIPHGTHLISNVKKEELKLKYELQNKKVLSTFGLLSSNKSIETTLTALPAIIAEHPTVMFLIIGITHPSVLKKEGGKYRAMLHEKVEYLHLQKHVKFINQYLPLPKLLEYLQLTDIYLFTSTDKNQAVSGTFSYAISCGCPVISTPIPHAREVLKDDAGIVINFDSPIQLANAANKLLADEELRTKISNNGLFKMASTAWENSALAHGKLFQKISSEKIIIRYQLPTLSLTHVEKMTTNFGMLQFSKIADPDKYSGYTLDDNARALIVMCKHYRITKNKDDLRLIQLYFNFIKFCLKPDGTYYNYVDIEKRFTTQNESTNLDDSNGRALWALGYMISMLDILPLKLVVEGIEVFNHSIAKITESHSTRAMAFAIKGMYYFADEKNIKILKTLADRMVQMYRHEKTENWKWFESYLTYGNSLLPEAMLCAWQATNDNIYKEIAQESFDFLLSKTFTDSRIKVVSNNGWLHNDTTQINEVEGGEQPIDVAYTILALDKFYNVFHLNEYKQKIHIAYNWFLGNNKLNQIVYNPCTGGCYDGLEENNVNLNQGAESTLSYLLSHMVVEQLYSKNGKHSYENTWMKNVKLLNE